MRGVLRNSIFSYFALLIISKHFDGIVFAGNVTKSMLLVALGIGVIELFVKPIFKLMSLPSEGLWFFILNFLVCLVSLYLLDKVLSGFSIGEGSTLSFTFVGFVVESFKLTQFWAYVSTSVLFSAIFGFLLYLCSGKK